MSKKEKKPREERPALVERDVSWMYFNHRILAEAGREDVPLLERLSFLGIYSNNLDEFYRVRVATLTRLSELREKPDRLEAEQAEDTLATIAKLNRRYHEEFERTWEALRRALADNGIDLCTEDDLDAEAAEYLDAFYCERLNGATNPVLLQEETPLATMGDSDLYLAVRLRRLSKSGKKNVTDYAIVDVPTAQAGRFLTLPNTTEGRIRLMMMDDVVRHCLPRIFAGSPYNDFEAYAFKFTKDAEMELDGDLRHGVVEKISRGIKSRRRGAPLRFVYDEQMPSELRKKLLKHLDCGPEDTLVPGGRYHNLKDLMSVPVANHAELRYPKWKPLFIPELDGQGAILEAVRHRDYLLHYPYHSFEMFVRLLREAALSHDVTAIRMTIYRLARDSKVASALICAARNGKKVTAVVELLARFDESRNIDWSKRLQDAGVRVVFGVEGLKTHAKLLHISSRRGDLCAVCTGNFHEGNARTYTDYAYLTARPRIVAEVEQLFGFIERPYAPVDLHQLVVSPNDMRRRLIDLINRCLRAAEKGKTADITLKLNHVTDPALCGKLLEAARAGVNVRLLVRGNCSLRSQTNLTITAIIDRYLEHARILLFRYGDEERCLIGSADWMPRNLDNRIEAYVAVDDERLRAELRQTVEWGLCDTLHGHRVDGEGGDPLLRDVCTGCNAEPFRSQEQLYEYYKQTVTNTKPIE